jgi:hypothetical protein
VESDLYEQLSFSLHSFGGFDESLVILPADGHCVSWAASHGQAFRRGEVLPCYTLGDLLLIAIIRGVDVLLSEPGRTSAADFPSQLNYDVSQQLAIRVKSERSFALLAEPTQALAFLFFAPKT